MKFKVEDPIFRPGPRRDTERLSNLPNVTQPVARPACPSLALCSYLPPARNFPPNPSPCSQSPQLRLAAVTWHEHHCDSSLSHTCGLAPTSSCPLFPDKSFETQSFLTPLPSTKVHSSSVHFSHSVVSDSLQPHELQHARPPCPSPTPGVHSNSHPLSQ